MISIPAYSERVAVECYCVPMSGVLTVRATQFLIVHAKMANKQERSVYESQEYEAVYSRPPIGTSETHYACVAASGCSHARGVSL